MSARACGVPLLLLFTLLALAASYPSEDQDWRRNRFRNPSQEDELVIVPLGGVRPRGVDDRAVEEFGGSNEDSSMQGSLAGFFQGMQAMIWQLRNQMAEVLRRIPQESFEGSNGFEMGPWSGLPGNTTSTTKVINGHVVTVNETTYSNNNNGSSAVFHIKVVDIKPQDSGEQAEFIGTNEEVSAVSDSVESLSSPLISKTSPDSGEMSAAMSKWLSKMSRRPYYPTKQQGTKNVFAKPVFQRGYGADSEDSNDSVNRLDSDVENIGGDNDWERNNGHVIDLSRDTLVNKLMSDQQNKGGLVALHPDVEILDVEDGKVLGSVDDSYTQKRTNEPVREDIYWKPKYNWN